MSVSENVKECFVLMPAEGDCEKYKPGHFRRVYETIIEPTIKEVGMIPVKGKEIDLHEELQLETIQKLINAPLAICDLSSLNRKISLGIGIRNTYNKPTILLWDDVTPKAYYINNIDCIDYSKNLEKTNLRELRNKLKESIINSLNK